MLCYVMLCEYYDTLLWDDKSILVTEYCLNMKHNYILTADLFIIHGYITNSQYDQLLVSLKAQLVEHCTSIAEVMGSNPIQA